MPDARILHQTHSLNHADNRHSKHSGNSHTNTDTLRTQQPKPCKTAHTQSASEPDSLVALASQLLNLCCQLLDSVLQRCLRLSRLVAPVLPNLPQLHVRVWD
eukprot:3917667-Rhodomonas_salina.2